MQNQECKIYLGRNNESNILSSKEHFASIKEDDSIQFDNISKYIKSDISFPDGQYLIKSKSEGILLFNKNR